MASPSLVTGSADDSGHGHSAFDAPDGAARDRARPSGGGLTHSRQTQPDDGRLIHDAQALLQAFAGRDAAALLSSVTELCRLLAARGSTRRAERLLLEMLPIGEGHLDRDHAALGHVLHELAHIYLREARHAEAEPLLLRLYYMQCRRCGKDHPDAAAVLATLARVRQALGQHDDAESMWRQVIAVCERSLGSDHPATTTAVERLAESCAARGKLREAQVLRAQAATMRASPMAGALPAPAVLAEVVDARSLGVARKLAEASALPEAAADAGDGAPVRPLVVLPAPNGALTVEEQPSFVPALHETTQETLLALHKELQATGGEPSEAGGRRAWPALAAAAAVFALLGGLTASGAASTFGAERAAESSPRWAAWNAQTPVTPRSDPDAVAATESASYEVRLAAEAPAPTDPAIVHALVRARLIGPVPRLPLPALLAERQIDDEVRVRFVVDAHGIPDTTSVAVLRTSHEALTDIARHAIGDLRFVPARGVTPGAPSEADVVEMSFRFSRQVQ